jgi:chaperonin GroES
MAKGKKVASDIVPLGERVLIKPLSEEELSKKSPSGIIIPETVDREKTDRGTVMAVGEGKRDENGKVIPLRVKKGDRVLFQWGDKIDIENEEYYIVGENNILAILK